MLSLGDDDSAAFVSATNTILPLIATHFKLDDTGTLYAGNNNLGNHRAGLSLFSASQLVFENDYNNGGKVSGISDFLTNNIFCAQSSVTLGNGSFSRDTGTGQNYEVDYTFSGGALGWLDNIGAYWGSNVNVVGGSVSGSANVNLDLSPGCRGYIQQASIINSEHDCLAVRGSNCVINLCTVRKDGANDSADDVVVSDGGVVSIINSNCGVSQTANTITANGIIMR